MAGSYTDNQPNFAWLEPYETKEFSQYWYPIQKIGTPDYANLKCALSLQPEHVWIQATETFGNAHVEITCGDETVLSEQIMLNAASPVMLPWTRPDG